MSSKKGVNRQYTVDTADTPVYIFTVLHDPERIFSAGAEFGKKDFLESLRKGESWTSGMIVCGTDSRVFMVYRTELQDITEIVDKLLKSRRHLTRVLA